MNMPMTREEFLEARVAFGADLSKWPEGDKDRAEAFLASDEGACVLASEAMLDAELAVFSSVALSHGDVSVFLDRLLDVPGGHPRRQSAKTQGFFAPLVALVSDIRKALSPVGVVSQGVGYALVLFVGVFVGLQQPGSETASMDLSATLFDTNTTFYFEDQ